MPVEFLTEEQKNQYGCFSGEPNETQLARYFHLDNNDLTLINKCRGEYNRLGFALQLTTVRFLGTFLSDPTKVPAGVILFIAEQLGITDVGCLEKYMHRKTTRYTHSDEIQQYYGYHDFNTPPWKTKLSEILYNRAWISNERPSLMFDFATIWLIQHKVLLPGATTLSRLISGIRKKAANQLWQQLSSLPNQEQIEKLKTILIVPDGSRVSRFDYLRRGPFTISGPAFNKAIDRYQELKEFGLQELDFSHIPPVRLKNLARHAGVVSMYKIDRMPDDKKIATLVAFVKAFEVIALDDALDVLDLLITDIAGAAKKLGQKKRLRTLKDLDKSALTLAEVGAFILSHDNQEHLAERLFSKFSKEQLTKAITTVNDLARPQDDNYYDEMVEQYGRVRRFLPRLLNKIEFKAAPAGTTTIAALNYLAKFGISRKQIFEDPPTDIVTKPWERLVFNKDNHATKQGYTLCFLDRLQDNLRRRDIYVKNSERWGDPRQKLLQGKDWEAKRLPVCQSLGHPELAQDAISNLTQQLDATYKKVAANFNENSSVRIDHSGKHPSLTITNLDKLEDPPSLTLLSDKVTALLPKVDLTELILEIHAHTGFANEFIHISESNARADDLPISICAVLLAEACNIGIEPLIKHNVPALTRHRLSWVKQNYIRAETLVRANALLVDYQATLELAQKWGGGEVASADGMRFVTPIRTINAGPNRKYFGTDRGITWYNFISDQFSGFHGIVIPGTLRDSIFILEGLLEQQTSLKPSEIMADTSGTSYLIFGLFWLLGFQFSPRLADAGEAVFWRIDKSADYGDLNDIARGCINPEIIEQHWDDVLRIAGSLKLGTIQASELIRSLLKSERPSSLTQAIIEIGRINKTLYLLNYIDNEEYRRRILTQLNRGEGRHAVARIINHGNRGEIRQRYREGQEDQLGALGLVTNAVILWNTIYMQAALDHMRKESFEIKKEDESRLSPLLYGHINVLGHYSFILNDMVMKGQLRPLNHTAVRLESL